MHGGVFVLVLQLERCWVEKNLFDEHRDGEGFHTGTRNGTKEFFFATEEFYTAGRFQSSQH